MDGIFGAFTISEDHAEMCCGKCGGWLHIGSGTLADAIRTADIHTAGCQGGVTPPQ